jgi:phosphoglycolate phosphatase
MTLKETVKGVVFDLDGTLLDTLEGHARSFNRALSSLGFPEQPVDAYRYFIGDGAAKCAQRCLPVEKQNDNALIEHCVELFQQDYASSWAELTRPYAGIEQVLLQLAALDMPLAVLSNKDDVFTQEMIATSFEAGLFKCVAGYGYQNVVQHKPDTSGPELIASNLAVNIRELAMVGDTATDMETAARSAMVPIGVLWGFRERDELVGAGAASVVSTPEELIRLFD